MIPPTPRATRRFARPGGMAKIVPVCSDRSQERMWNAKGADTFQPGARGLPASAPRSRSPPCRRAWRGWCAGAAPRGGWPAPGRRRRCRGRSRRTGRSPGRAGPRRRVKSRVSPMPTSGAAASAASQPRARAGAAAAGEAQRHRVDPVGEVVGEHRGGDHHADRRRHLEGEPDAEAVQQAVGGEAGRAEMPGPALGGGAQRALQQHVAAKADPHDPHHQSAARRSCRPATAPRAAGRRARRRSPRRRRSRGSAGSAGGSAAPARRRPGWRGPVATPMAARSAMAGRLAMEKVPGGGCGQGA